MGPYPIKYRVVAETSSLDDPKTTDHGWHILFESNNFQEARKEAIEWAAYDDIKVYVMGRYYQQKFVVDGYGEATERYPKTAAAA